jgi:hypothetical protein
LEIGHGGAQKIVFYVKAVVAGAIFGIGDGAVDVELRIHHGDSGGAGIAGVVEFVAAGGHWDSMGFCFLGTDVTDKIGVGNLAFWGDVRFGDEENSTRASDAVFWRAIQAESM